MNDQGRIYDANGSFVEGRQTELIIHRYLEKAGLIVVGTKANEKHYDLIIIDPLQSKEYIAQIKSSKNRTPYVTCHNYEGLLLKAKEIHCEPVIIFSFTTDRAFCIFHAESKLILFSNHPEYTKGQFIPFNCWNKEK